MKPKLKRSFAWSDRYGMDGELERRRAGVNLSFPLEPWFGKFYRRGEDCTAWFSASHGTRLARHALRGAFHPDRGVPRRAHPRGRRACRQDAGDPAPSPRDASGLTSRIPVAAQHGAAAGQESRRSATAAQGDPSGPDRLIGESGAGRAVRKPWTSSRQRSGFSRSKPCEVPGTTASSASVMAS